MSGIMLATCCSATGNSSRACAQLNVYISGDQEHLGMSTRRFVSTTCTHTEPYIAGPLDITADMTADTEHMPAFTEANGDIHTTGLWRTAQRGKGSLTRPLCLDRVAATADFPLHACACYVLLNTTSPWNISIIPHLCDRPIAICRLLWLTT